MLRWAVVSGREEELPLGQEHETHEEIVARIREGRRDEYLRWWSPDIWSVNPYDRDHDSFGTDRVLYHRPSPEDSDEYFEPYAPDVGDEVPTPTSEGAMEVDE